jgi:hypothetical protein
VYLAKTYVWLLYLLKRHVLVQTGRKLGKHYTAQMYLKDLQNKEYL